MLPPKHQTAQGHFLDRHTSYSIFKEPLTPNKAQDSSPASASQTPASLGAAAFATASLHFQHRSIRFAEGVVKLHDLRHVARPLCSQPTSRHRIPGAKISKTYRTTLSNPMSSLFLRRPHGIRVSGVEGKNLTRCAESSAQGSKSLPHQKRFVKHFLSACSHQYFTLWGRP